MKSTSIRLPAKVCAAISEADDSFGEIARPALESYLVNRMVGRCVVTGEPLYTHSNFMAVSSQTPLANVLGIEGVDRFVIEGEVGSDISEKISTGNQDSIDIEPDYLNQVGSVLYAAEEEYLSQAHEHYEMWNQWAYVLLDDNEIGLDHAERTFHLLIWYDGDIDGECDRDLLSLQAIWDATPESAQKEILRWRNQRSVDDLKPIDRALDKVQ